MNVLIAEHAGFCFGVEKAIEKAYEEIEANVISGPVYSLGPIIHNHQVVEQLESKGLKTINEISDAEYGTVIIRSHGVPEITYKEIENRGLRLVDTTCPFVKKIQRIVSEHHAKGHRIIIIGNRTHPEVIGINGWCNDEGLVISEPHEVGNIPENDTLCVVAQTTMPIDLFKSIKNELTNRNQTIHWYNTICLATQDRQQTAHDLAGKVGAMVVIGGKHSSNTKKLAEVCRGYLPNGTYLIEKYTDLPLGLLSEEESVGITAGASTPKKAIEDTMQLLRAVSTGEKWQVAIDGPAGAGKSTIARQLADRLHFIYIDTGAMYRALTWYIINNKCDMQDVDQIIRLAHSVKIDLKEDKVYLDGKDVSEAIRSLQVTQHVSAVAGIKDVRQAMVKLQQEIAKKNHVVMDGRDIGTVVLPEASLKVFLTATVEERARRRFEELKNKTETSYDEVKEQIEARDHADETREHDPLIPANDAVQIDSTRLSIEEVVEKIILLFCDRIKQRSRK